MKVSYKIIVPLLVGGLFLQMGSLAATNQYLFIGHPRDDGPGEIVQRDVERVDYAAFDLLLLGGDYTWHGTGSRAIVAYIAYGVSSPWPSEPDNLGPSLMLIDPGLDPDLVINWATSDQDGGTPGRANIPSPWPGTLVVDGNTATVRWNGLAAQAWYRLDSTPILNPSNWQPVGPLVQSMDSWMDLVDTNAANSVQRYYRLSREFP